MRRIVRFVVVAALSASPASALPQGMSVIAANETLPAYPAPDGKRYAFWKGEDVVVHTAGGALEHAVRAGITSGDCTELAWSPSARELAFSSEHGLHVLDVGTGRTRVVDPAPSCVYAFRADGVLHYVKSSGVTATLWKEGSFTFLARLPKGNEYRMSATAAVVGDADPQSRRMSAVWMVDLASYRQSTLFSSPSGGPFDIRVSRGRICFDAPPRGQCVEVATGARTEIAPPGVALRSIGPYREDLPFSPSGDMLAFLGDAGGAKQQLYVRELATGTVRALGGMGDHESYTFVDDRTIVLSDVRGIVDPLVAVDSSSGARRSLVKDTTQYVSPRGLLGKTDLLLIGRERDATRDLVRWQGRYAP